MFSSSPCFFPANTIDIYNIYPSTEQLPMKIQLPHLPHYVIKKCILCSQGKLNLKKREHMCHAHGCPWDTGTWRDLEMQHAGGQLGSIRLRSLSWIAEIQAWADDGYLLQLQHLSQHWSISVVSGNKTFEYARNMPSFSFHFPLSWVPVQLEASPLTAKAQEVKENNWTLSPQDFSLCWKTVDDFSELIKYNLGAKSLEL